MGDVRQGQSRGCEGGRVLPPLPSQSELLLAPLKMNGGRDGRNVFSWETMFPIIVEQSINNTSRHTYTYKLFSFGVLCPRLYIVVNNVLNANRSLFHFARHKHTRGSDDLNIQMRQTFNTDWSQQTGQEHQGHTALTNRSCFLNDWKAKNRWNSTHDVETTRRCWLKRRNEEWLFNAYNGNKKPQLPW